MPYPAPVQVNPLPHQPQRQFCHSARTVHAPPRLCRSVVDDVNGVSYNCAATNNGNSNYCPNNSSSQGQLFYENIGVNNSPPHYSVYAVDNCVTAEGVGAGNVPGYFPTAFNGTISGFSAIIDDMVGHTSGTTVIPPQCVRRNHSQ